MSAFICVEQCSQKKIKLLVMLLLYLMQAVTLCRSTKGKEVGMMGLLLCHGLAGPGPAVPPALSSYQIKKDKSSSDKMHL